MLHNGTALPMAGVVAAFGLAGLAINRLLVRPAAQA